MIQGVNTRREYDKLMMKELSECDNISIKNNLLHTIFNENNGVSLYAMGYPIEFLRRKIQRLKQPLLWVELAMAIKVYYEDKQIQNYVNQIPMIWDLEEIAWNDEVKKIQRNGWDSTTDLIEQIQYNCNNLYEILYHEQSIYYYNNLLRLPVYMNEKTNNKPILCIVGQGIADKIVKLIENDYNIKIFDYDDRLQWNLR